MLTRSFFFQLRTYTIPFLEESYEVMTEDTQGGHGANSFGGPFQQVVPNDPEHDILAALIHWVEDGVAPTTIIATKFNNDIAADGVAFTRPLCMVRSDVTLKVTEVRVLTRFAASDEGAVPRR